MNENARIIRLVVCHHELNLVEVQPVQFTFHHWFQQFAILRLFVEFQQLVSSDVQVTLIERKKEIAMHETGHDFLYGQLIAKDCPVELFMGKWDNRFQQE